jgi:hypothetical protein
MLFLLFLPPWFSAGPQKPQSPSRQCLVIKGDSEIGLFFSKLLDVDGRALSAYHSGTKLKDK